MPRPAQILQRFSACKFPILDQVVEPDALNLMYCFAFKGNPDEGTLSIYRACEKSQGTEVPMAKEWYAHDRLWFFSTHHSPSGFDAYVEYTDDHRDKVYVQLERPLLSIALSLKEEQAA